MDVTPLVKEGAQIIQGYSADGYRVSGELYDGAVLVFPDRTHVWSISNDVKELSAADFQPLFDVSETLDVVLFGTGEKLVFPDADLRRALKDKGLHVEFMDSGAACRTYNVLMAEGRQVVAALLSL